MPITTGQLDVGTTATVIDGTHNSNFKITIQNLDNTDTLYIGGPDVTPANGLGLVKLSSMQFDMNPLDRLYCVSTKTGHHMSYMKQV